MLNKRPIFIIAFTYGGSNILLNLLRSHPDVCSPRGELHQVFKGRKTEPLATRMAKIWRYLPCAMMEGGDFLAVNAWEYRKPLKSFTRKRLDRILFDEKFRAMHPSQNLYKYENVPYQREEIAASRLLCKNLDGLTYLTPELSAMYPDATFLALVRNGLAVCEGHLRRGYDLETMAINYEKGCRTMLRHSKEIPNYHVISYEDIVASPLEMLRKIYDFAALDFNKVPKIRFESKKVIGKTGEHAVVHGKGYKEMMWHTPDQLENYLEKDVNENQIKRLTEAQKALILKRCRPSLETFGYLPRS